MSEQIKQLEEKLHALAEADQGFARSLIRYHKYKGYLSDKQWHWVEKFLARIADSWDTSKPPSAVHRGTTVSVGNFSQVIKLFEHAKSKIKFPKIMLQVGLQSIALTIAGERATAPGTVNVTDGKPYGKNIWFGRVTPAGEWQVNLGAPEASLRVVEDLLFKLSDKPSETAQEYGRLTGRCSFCNRPLTDDQSVAAGFGETCAKTFGLHAQWKSATPVLEKETA